LLELLDNDNGTSQHSACEADQLPSVAVLLLFCLL